MNSESSYSITLAILWAGVVKLGIYKGSIPGLERSPGGGCGNPLQYSFLENPMDRRGCWATVHGSESDMTEAT